jgi:hypothetical protein
MACFVQEGCLDRSSDEVEYAAILLSTGFDRRPQHFDDATARCALAAEREFSPDHWATQ